jgi:putative transposase
MIDFKGYRFFKGIILMTIRWYVAYALSYRDIEELMKERGVPLDHSTIQRWVVKFLPLLCAAFKKRKVAVNGSWRVDETYIKIKGQWCYQYRAVDKYGFTIDFMLSKHRDADAAKRFFKKAIRSSGQPHKVTIDKSGANTAGTNAINETLEQDKRIEIRQVKYLNNIVEQDHRFIKKLTKPTKGFKSFNSARATLSGIELHHMLRKGQYRENAVVKTAWEQFYSLAA